MLDRNWISELVVPLPDSKLGSFRLVNWSSYITSLIMFLCLKDEGDIAGLN
jgi:hypothetical protein